jgi:hypothetical protein
MAGSPDLYEVERVVAPSARPCRLTNGCEDRGTASTRRVVGGEAAEAAGAVKMAISAGQREPWAMIVRRSTLAVESGVLRPAVKRPVTSDPSWSAAKS